jgi:hypothetical protein
MAPPMMPAVSWNHRRAFGTYTGGKSRWRAQFLVRRWYTWVYRLFPSSGAYIVGFCNNFFIEVRC